MGHRRMWLKPETLYFMWLKNGTQRDVTETGDYILCDWRTGHGGVWRKPEATWWIAALLMTARKVKSSSRQQLNHCRPAAYRQLSCLLFCWNSLPVCGYANRFFEDGSKTYQTLMKLCGRYMLYIYMYVVVCSLHAIYIYKILNLRLSQRCWQFDSYGILCCVYWYIRKVWRLVDRLDTAGADSKVYRISSNYLPFYTASHTVRYETSTCNFPADLLKHLLQHFLLMQQSLSFSFV